MLPRRPRLFLLSLAAVGLFAQPVPKPQQKPQAPKPQPVVPPTPEDEKAETLEHVKFPYQPALVRDPFASPTDNADKVREETIDEIGVLGWLVLKGKPYVIVSDSRGKTRQLPVGFRFKDGEILSINDKAVVFRQWDPTATIRTGKVVEKQFKRKEGKQ